MWSNKLCAGKIEMEYENYPSVIINVEGVRYVIIQTINKYLDSHYPSNSNQLETEFRQKYIETLEKLYNIDDTDYLKLKRLITQLIPSLKIILTSKEDFNDIYGLVVPIFNTWLENARQQVKSQINKQNIVLKGEIPEIKYYCRFCKEQFPIPEDQKLSLLNSTDKIILPLHHELEMELRIIKKVEKPEESKNFPSFPLQINNSDFSAEKMLGIEPLKEIGGDIIHFLSVGIDIGSSTSLLIFSRLTMQRELNFFNPTNRYVLVKRDIIYESKIIFTPLIDRYTIDVDAVINFLESEYKNAGINKYMVDTGAVIVTGETAKKKNADIIVKRISSESGKFVSASAGPNFESQLCALGSGIVDISREKQTTIMNIDIGGGSTKLAIVKNGIICSTSSINIGGHLLGIKKDFKIWRIDEPTEILMNSFDMNYKIGDIITKEDIKTLSQEYAHLLFEVILGPAKSPNAKRFMMTEDLDYSLPIDKYSFSGGVAELIFGANGENFDDIGQYLAKDINILVNKLKLQIIEPPNKIRATVIGVGAFSLSVSGSTCNVDKTISLPIMDIPVIPVDVVPEQFSEEKIISGIQMGYKKFDLHEEKDLVALYFQKPIFHSYNYLVVFAKAIEKALLKTANNELPLILLFEMDFARVLGTTIKRETSIKRKIICLDELTLKTGDWIDIGAEMQQREVYPVTIKSLAFNKSIL